MLQRGDLLTESFARELHRRMPFGGIWSGAGRYRTSGRQSGWEPERIAEGVRMFLDDAEGWIRFSDLSGSPRSRRSGCTRRLVAIRITWSNGNGQHARLLADVVVASHGEVP